MQSNYLGLLGLARRAGMIEAGDEAVRASISQKRARVVLIASDASERTHDTFIFIAESAGIPVITLDETREQLGNALGKRPCAAVAVCDIGMSAAIVNKLATSNTQAQAVREQLSARAEKIAARKNKGKRKK